MGMNVYVKNLILASILSETPNCAILLLFGFWISIPRRGYLIMMFAQPRAIRFRTNFGDESGFPVSMNKPSVEVFHPPVYYSN